MNKLDCLVAHINSGRGLNGFVKAEHRYVTRTLVNLSINGKPFETMSYNKAVKLLSKNCNVHKIV